MAEVQREKRTPCRIDLKFAVSETGILFTGLAGNHSPRGLCFESVHSVPPGQSIHIRTERPLPNQIRCHICGEVRWCQMRCDTADAVYRMGVKLTD